jgi:hypothetical protein
LIHLGILSKTYGVGIDVGNYSQNVKLYSLVAEWYSDYSAFGEDFEVGLR